MAIDREHPGEDVRQEIQAIRDFLQYVRELSPPEAIVVLATALGLLTAYNIREGESWEKVEALARDAFSVAMKTRGTKP